MVLYLRLSTAVDHVDEIAIATLYLLVMMIMAVWIRLAFRYYMLRSLHWDDGMVSLALALAIAQSAVIFTGTQHGLGKPQSDMPAGHLTTVEKDVYSSDLLYVLSLSLAKVSVFQFLGKLCVKERHISICRWSSLLIAVWTVPVFFALAFKCGTSSPWDVQNGRCIKVFDFWASISIIDIATELVICILPIHIVKPVRISVSKKVTVIVAFIFRAFVIITTIARLIFMKRSTEQKTDDAAAFATRITTQLNLCLGLMTACIPCLKPFLDAFDSGMLNVSLHKRIGGRGGYSNSSYGAAKHHGNSYELGSVSGTGRGITKSSSNNNNNISRFQYMEDEIEGLGTSASAFAVTAPPMRPADGIDDATTTTTTSMTIQRTDQWSVKCEYVDGHHRAAGSLGVDDDDDEMGIPEDRERSRRGNSPL